MQTKTVSTKPKTYFFIFKFKSSLIKVKSVQAVVVVDFELSVVMEATIFDLITS